MKSAILNIFNQVGVSGFADILFMSLIIYFLIVWLKKSKAGFILTGIFIVGIIYIFSQLFNMVLTTFVLQGFFAIILIAIVIIFQKEIRQLFEQVALWSLNPRIKSKNQVGLSLKPYEIISQTLVDLANQKIGALVVIPFKDDIDSFLDGGTDLNGKISEKLLKSIFDPNSIGHDGAAVVSNDRLTQFSCHLPLSQNFMQLQNRGTRHAAALGLAENCDALCLVVSEERGQISVARDGVLTSLPKEHLGEYLKNFYNEVNPSKAESKSWMDFFKKDFRYKIVAFCISALLWFVFVHESRPVYKSYNVPVKYTALPTELDISKIVPEEIEVTFSGPKREFYLVNKNEINLFIKIPDATVGVNRIGITDQDVNYPKSIVLENIRPKELKVYLKKKSNEK